MDKTDQRTIRDFAEQWSRYPDNEGFYGSSELFADIIRPLIEVEEFKDRTVLEIGSGTGRIVTMLLAAGTRRVYAVEPAPEAFAALQRNTSAHRSRVECLNMLGQDLPAGLGVDFVLSIGVIHHIAHPDATMRACYRVLRPGGRCLLWVYGREGNETYLRFALPLRRVTVALPHMMLAGLCHALNGVLGGYIALCRWFPLPLRDYARNVIGRMSRDKRYLVIYDQLNPAHAEYYSQSDARRLLSDAGFVDVRTHHRRGYSWTVIGTRPL